MLIDSNDLEVEVILDDFQIQQFFHHVKHK